VLHFDTQQAIPHRTQCFVLYKRLHANTIAVSPHRKNLSVKFRMPFEETAALASLQGYCFIFTVIRFASQAAKMR